MSIKIILLFYLITQFSALFKTVVTVNNRPIIGILTQEVTNSNKDKYNSYIAASYVKFVEGAGARVIPIWIGRDNNYYNNILSKINGVLLPGGAANFTHRNGYADAGFKIYSIAKRMNDDGIYFPILGICLGFELLTYVAANRTKHRTKCSSENQSLPLKFCEDFRNSKLFGSASQEIIDILEVKAVTANYHHYCVTEKSLTRVGLINQFHITSYNVDDNGIQFVSSLEDKHRPFYGLQFHPEKNLYEWKLGIGIPHGVNAIRIAQYFANFFINEARRNSLRFNDKDEESRSLIYNYHPQYDGMDSTFMQRYYFQEALIY